MEWKDYKKKKLENPRIKQAYDEAKALRSTPDKEREPERLEEWKKEFDKKFAWLKAGMPTTFPEIKSFIHSLLASSRSRLIEEVEGKIKAVFYEDWENICENTSIEETDKIMRLNKNNRLEEAVLATLRKDK